MLYTLKECSSDKEMGVTEKMLAKIAVELHGAGQSDRATANAMAWQSEVIASTEPVIFELNGKKFSIKPQEQV